MSGRTRDRSGTVEAQVYRIIRTHGPIKPQAIRELLPLHTKWGVLKAVHRLRDKGFVMRLEHSGACFVPVKKQAPKDGRGDKSESRRNLTASFRRRGLAGYVEPPPVMAPTTALEQHWGWYEPSPRG